MPGEKANIGRAGRMIGAVSGDQDECMDNTRPVGRAGLLDRRCVDSTGGRAYDRPPDGVID